jgi:hypothetical protein
MTATVDKPTIDTITKKPAAKPSRILLHAPPKWGKTSFAAQAPDVVFIKTRAEDGLDTLIRNKQIEETANFPNCVDTWNDLLFALNELYLQKHDHRWVAIDTINGAATLCIEHVQQYKFQDDPEKFDAYGRGMKPNFTPKEFGAFIRLLDAIRNERKMGVILLAHSQVKTFTEPGHPPYDRWEPVLAKEIAAIVDRWVDMILFGDFETYTTKERKTDAKARADGGSHRIIRAGKTAIHEAGNRCGLPDEIDGGTNAKEAWANFKAALQTQK